MPPIRPTHLTRYLAITLLIALLPVTTEIHLNFPLHLLVKPVPFPSALNLDSGENNQYSISGFIKNTDLIPNSDQLFVNLYRTNEYRVVGLIIFREEFVATLTVAPTGNFKIDHLPAGRYKLKPLSLPKQNIFFTRSYPLTIKDHNPPPIAIDQPHTRMVDFLLILVRRTLDQHF